MEVKTPDFHSPNLASIIEMLPPAIIDELPYGVIRLDAEGHVIFFSEAERRLSGYSRETLTRSFFTEIAPCMNNRDFRGRIEAGLARGKLNIRFSYAGDFNNATRVLSVRVQSATNGGCWLFISRPCHNSTE
jgi:photoactive yellow protein